MKLSPLRGNGVLLRIKKRRLWCKPCARPFTEPLPGIRPGKRTTERYLQAVTWAAENFSSLSQVRVAYKCSASFLYAAYYSRLERKLREKLSYPWSSTIGVDEHTFKRCPETGRVLFVSMIVDYNNRRVRELALGKTGDDLRRDLDHIPGRENVKNVIIDMCDPFKNFAREFFPNSILIADKFHVLRLLSPTILRRRKDITGDRANSRARRLLLMSSKKLDYGARLALFRFLSKALDCRFCSFAIVFEPCDHRTDKDSCHI